MKTGRYLAIVGCLVWVIIVPIPSLAENSGECQEDFKKLAESFQQSNSKEYELIESENLKDHCVFKLFKKIAENGSAKGAFNVGIMHAEGVGTPKNDELAVEWFRKAAKEGEPDAQYILGVRYLHGQREIRNYVLAYTWLSQAAAAGNDKAIRARDLVANWLTSEQIIEAQQLSRDLAAQ